MERYKINLFNEKVVYYYGMLDGAKEYALHIARHFVLSWRGSIIIECGGRKVAEGKIFLQKNEFGEYEDLFNWL